MKIEEYLGKIIEHLGIEGEIEIKIEEGEDRLQIDIEVDEQDTALLIGTRGETLDAIELLTKLSFKDDYPEKRIGIDINGYKKRQEDRLKEKAIQIADQVLETGRAYEFRYLNSYERHLVHECIAEDTHLKGLSTHSEDRDNGRVLIVSLAETEVEVKADNKTEVAKEVKEVE